MFLLSPSSTLVIMLFLGAGIHSLPFYLKNFINPEAPEDNGMMDKRSFNPYPFFLRRFVYLEALKDQAVMDTPILTPHSNEYTYVLDFDKIRAGSPWTQYRSLIPHTTTRVFWRSRAGIQEDISMVGKRAAFIHSYGFNFGLRGQGSIQKMPSTSYNPYDDKRWYLRFLRTIHPNNKEYSVATHLAKNSRKSPTILGSRVFYGRGGVSYGRV